MSALFSIMLAMLVECGLLLIASIGVICVIFWITNSISAADFYEAHNKRTAQERTKTPVNNMDPDALS
jgi:hypothetical protein